LELKSGPPWHLYEIALQLLDSIPLSIENRSKAERGYALFRGDLPGPVKAPVATLTADMSVNDAFKATAWAALDHLQANRRGVLESRDPEYLHQARVALRRLRSAFGIFADVLPETATAPLADELKWLTGSLGPARDWDVFVTETLPPILDEFADRDGLPAFRRRCVRLRRSARHRAQEALDSRRCQRLILDLCGWLVAESWPRQADEAALAALRAPAVEFARAVLERRFDRVRKRGRKLKQLPAAGLHRLRIAVKKLRYAVDFFATLFDAKHVSGMRAPLVRLQDILGAINDAATVAALIGTADAESGKAMAEARGIVIGWSSERVETLKRELGAAWKAFRGGGKFW
ncbi:MAG TPA: CHAD domain-containing protein, partial [Burkholderiales bacterium]|nr:CHAD domain-containing protein [Burkholderiales bacterium]